MRLIADINAGTIRPCTQFFDVVELYDARNKIVHGGSLGLTESQESQAARFIACVAAPARAPVVCRASRC